MISKNAERRIELNRIIDNTVFLIFQFSSLYFFATLRIMQFSRKFQIRFFCLTFLYFEFYYILKCDPQYQAHTILNLLFGPARTSFYAKYLSKSYFLYEVLISTSENHNLLSRIGVQYSLSSSLSNLMINTLIVNLLC